MVAILDEKLYFCANLKEVAWNLWQLSGCHHYH
jgi:hypothetical protein